VGSRLRMSEVLGNLCEQRQKLTAFSPSRSERAGRIHELCGITNLLTISKGRGRVARGFRAGAMR
jgi:hypothetical protein